MFWQMPKVHCHSKTKPDFLFDLSGQTMRNLTVNIYGGVNTTVLKIHVWCTPQLLGQVCISRAGASRSCVTKMAEQKVRGSNVQENTSFCQLWHVGQMETGKLEDIVCWCDMLPLKDGLQSTNFLLLFLAFKTSWEFKKVYFRCVCVWVAGEDPTLVTS